MHLVVDSTDSVSSSPKNAMQSRRLNLEAPN
jgi:hypothetical protein